MMTAQLPDAAVEAAAKALHRAVVYPQGEDHSEHWDIFADTYREHAKAGLTAAMPHIREQIAETIRALRFTDFDDAQSARDYCALVAQFGAPARIARGGES